MTCSIRSTGTDESIFTDFAIRRPKKEKNDVKKIRVTNVQAPLYDYDLYPDAFVCIFHPDSGIRHRVSNSGVPVTLKCGSVIQGLISHVGMVDLPEFSCCSPEGHHDTRGFPPTHTLYVMYAWKATH